MVTEETKRKTADAMASKASTKQATDDEQVIQLKKQLQCTQLACADPKKAMGPSAKDGAHWKAQALHWKAQAEISLMRLHKTVTSLELPEFPVCQPYI